MLQVSDDVFDGEDEGHIDAGDTSSPDEGTNNHTSESHNRPSFNQICLNMHRT